MAVKVKCRRRGASVKRYTFGSPWQVSEVLWVSPPAQGNGQSCMDHSAKPPLLFLKRQDASMCSAPLML